jgi:hypothetical protein
MPRVTTITLAALMTATVAGSTPTLAQTGQPPAPRQQLTAQARASIQRKFFARCSPKMQAAGMCRATPASTGEPIPAFIGRGWNEITDEDLPSTFSCLDPVTVDNPGLVSPRIESRIKIVSNSSQVNDVMNLTGRISGRLPIQAVPISGSLQGDVLRLASIHESVITVVARTAITYSPQRIATVPAISQAALGTLTQSAIAFRDKCGDKFVEAVNPGGEFIALIQIFSRDTATQSKVAARISAGLGGDSGSPDQTAQALSTLLQEANVPSGAAVDTGGSVSNSFEGKELSIQIETLQRGGSNRSNITTVAELIARYRSFPSTVTRPEDTVPMGFRLQPYTAAGNGGQARGKLFGIEDRASLVSNILFPTYLNELTARDALTFWLQQCGTQAQTCALFFPYDLNRAQTTLGQIDTTIANIEAAVDQCGRGQACTQASLQALVPPDRGASLVAGLPVRKQFYSVGARAFKEAAEQVGALSSGAVVANPLPGLGQCFIDKPQSVPNLPTDQWVRIWTARGVTGTTCRFEIFKRAKLQSPWDVVNTDFDIPQSGNQVLEKMLSRSDLTLTLKQTSPLANINPDTTAILKGLLLVGPAGDPAIEPWRQAIKR